jgi:hypothetical protein
MWFAALAIDGRGRALLQREPWFLRFVYELLRGEASVRALLARDPFRDRPSHYVRAELYEYRFAPIGDPSGAYWNRRRVGEYLRPVALKDAAFREFLEDRAWLDEDDDGIAP